MANDRHRQYIPIHNAIYANDMTSFEKLLDSSTYKAKDLYDGTNVIRLICQLGRKDMLLLLLSKFKPYFRGVNTYDEDSLMCAVNCSHDNYELWKIVRHQVEYVEVEVKTTPEVTEPDGTSSSPVVDILEKIYETVYEPIHPSKLNGYLCEAYTHKQENIIKELEAEGISLTPQQINKVLRVNIHGFRLENIQFMKDQGLPVNLVFDNANMMDFSIEHAWKEGILFCLTNKIKAIDFDNKYLKHNILTQELTYDQRAIWCQDQKSQSKLYYDYIKERKKNPNKIRKNNMLYREYDTVIVL